MDEPDHIVSGGGDEDPVELPARRARIEVDGWLGGDAVALLGDRGEQLRQRTAVAVARGADLKRGAGTGGSSHVRGVECLGQRAGRGRHGGQVGPGVLRRSACCGRRRRDCVRVRGHEDGHRDGDRREHGQDRSRAAAGAGGVRAHQIARPRRRPLRAALRPGAVALRRDGEQGGRGGRAVEPGEPVPNDNYVVDEGHRVFSTSSRTGPR